LTAIRSLLGDRRRAQQGGVLSGVLIMVTFLAIIAGALMTELSTHFLISHVLVNRVGNEATVNSAMELALGPASEHGDRQRLPRSPPGHATPTTGHAERPYRRRLLRQLLAHRP